MELEAGVRRLAGILEQDLPENDSKEGYVFEFEGGLRLRVFSIPGRPIIFEGPLREVPQNSRDAEDLCKKMLQVGLARYRERPGELIVNEEGELCYAKQFMGSTAEQSDFMEEVETFLNELELMKGRASGTVSQSFALPFSPFSFIRP
jgi:hypothetical protein